MSAKKRLDLLLLEKALVSTRTKAQELISAGKVVVDGAVQTKAGEKLDHSAVIELLEQEHPYVSRGGLKMEAALRAFPFRVDGKTVMDVGVSTGGFAQCLLIHGARAIIGIDVGRGQLAPALRQDPRVTLLEQQDIRTLKPGEIPELVDRFTADVSFISLRLVLPAIKKFLMASGEAIILVKPQFELSPGEVGSGGIVRDRELHQKALQNVQDAAKKCGYRVMGVVPSPVLGGDGNQEFLMHLAWPS